MRVKSSSRGVSGRLISRTRGITIPGIVEKCLSSARAGTKAKAIEALLLYVEVDVPDPVLVWPSYIYWVDKCRKI